MFYTHLLKCAIKYIGGKAPRLGCSVRLNTYKSLKNN